MDKNLTNLPGAALGSRDKYWSELNADEKIERMRRELKRALRMAEEGLTNGHEVSERLNVHGHLDGKVVVPTNNYDIRANKRYVSDRIGDQEGDNVYF